MAEALATKNKKLLIVENDLLMLRVLQRRFIYDGYNVTSAIGGGDALAELREGLKPDLILLDILMPDIDGFEVLRQLQQDKEWKKIPVILLTNLTDDPKNIQKGLSLGAASYIVKTDTTLAEVVQKVEELLALKK